MSDPPPSSAVIEAQRHHRWLAAVVVPSVFVLMFAWSCVQKDVSRNAPRFVRSQSALVSRVLDGPEWPGEIETRTNEVPLPDGYVDSAECFVGSEAWCFRGRDLESVTTLARTAGVSKRQVTRMRASARCDAQGCSITPDAELIESMSPDVRSVLYQELRRFPENRMQAFAAERPVALGPWSTLPNVSPRLRDLLARGSWIERDRFAFSDLRWLCFQLETEAERREALQTLYTRYGLDAWVRVPPAEDLEPMVRYWSHGNDPAEVRRALLYAREHGGRASVAELLPALARVRLNRFPRASDPEYDCYWTATHFFDGPTPPDDFPGSFGIVKLIRNEYREIPMSEARLGDVIALYTSSGELVHTINLIARDLVFTKNGLSRSQAWLLMRLDDVLRAYRFTSPRAFRRR